MVSVKVLMQIAPRPEKSRLPHKGVKSILVKGSSPFLTFINGNAIDGTYGKTVTNRIP